MNEYIKSVKKIEFTILNPEKYKKYSVCEITESELYEKNNEPKIGGLIDPRMGPYDKNILCKTCKNNIEKCPGHFGHIELSVPVYYIQFLVTVKKILTMTCNICSHLLIDKNNTKIIKLLHNKKNENRFTYILSMISKTKKKVCYNCNRIQPKYIKDGITLNVERTVDKISNREVFHASKALKILKNILNEDIKLMGLSPTKSRPEWLICTIFPVPPPCIRPSVKHSVNLRSEDDIVYKYIDIIKANNALIKNKIKSEKKKEEDKYLNEYIEYLQYHITTLIDNDIKGVPPAQQRSGRSLKSIKERLKGKQGRIRGNLMGKRVDYSARSVVSPDPSLNIDQLGVPYIICRKITFPEIVNYYNFKKLEELIQNGPNKYPGANFIIKKNQNGEENKLDLRYVRNNLELRYGDVVERHLLEDDYVLFNRQPSLHKMSMCGHRVKPILGKSFRLNPSVCQPYNADFDGDEMNLFCPQTMQSMIEIANIACIPEQIISPQSNKPIIGCIMDIVVGSMKFTLKDTYINEEILPHILSKIPKFNGIIPKPDLITNNKKYWSGRTLISLIIPDNFNYFKSNDKENIEIVKGSIISGVFDKSIVGSSSGGLVHMITNDINELETKDFLDNIQQIINSWLKFEGFTIGYGDTITSKKLKNNVRDVIKTAKGDVSNFISMIYEKKIKISQDGFENKIFNKLNKARDDAGSIVMKSLNNSNNLFSMISSGSKGNFINISQISGIVGQQNTSYKGKSGRCQNTFYNRTLPYYKQNEVLPHAKGFVEHSYLEGLKVNEFFFHMQGGREGIIDTACKTAETGYIQRKLMKSLEDLKVHYDLTVRSENGCLVQFAYGGDNFDPKKVEKQQFELIRNNDNSFIKRYKWTEEQLIEIFEDIKNKKILDNEFRDLKKLRKEFRKRKFYLNDIVYQPINVFRIVKQSTRMFKKYEKSDIQPKYLLKKINEVMKIIKLNCDTDFPFDELNEYNLKLLRTLVRSKLSSKVIIYENKLSKEAFDWVIKIIQKKFYKALIQPAECVGSVTAQSLGEPTTQLTLNTFHYSGVSSKSNVNQGVPRIRELISVTKKPKTPSLTIYLKENYNKKELAKKVLNNIENLDFRYFVNSTSIYYDKNIIDSCIEEDKFFVRDYYNFSNFENIDFNQLSPWLLRIEINPLYLINKSMSMFEIYTSFLLKYHKKKIHIIYSDENSSYLVFHIRFIHNDIGDIDENNSYLTNKDQISLNNLEKDIMSNFVLKGIDKLKKVTMREIKTPRIKKDGLIDNKKEIVLDTTGTNLEQILILKKYINQNKTFSNDIHEVNELFGIETARQVLKDEINSVMSNSGIYINEKHLDLLCDSMTCKGILISMDRHGINKSDAGVLTKTSFEEPHEHFLKSSLFNIKDNMNSMTANLMMGQVGKFGTGMCDIVFDNEKLQKYAYDNKIQRKNSKKIIILNKVN
jgi:DNA-directed RNA polymerase II subunit RPB1